MNQDHSKAALFNPGKASVYFDTFAAHLDTDPEYSPRTALTLAELSRWVYNDDVSIRHAALSKVGLREIRFFDRDGTQCAVVVDKDRQVAALVFRGSSELFDWLQNIKAIPAPWSPVGNVHRGFKAALDEVWDEVEPCLAELHAPLLCGGHSLGAALAELAGSRLATAGAPPGAVYKFGGPPVGDSNFIRTLSDVWVHRIVNDTDIVGNLVLPGFEHAGMLKRVSARVINTGMLAPGLSWRLLPKFLTNHAPIQYVTALKLMTKEFQNA